MHVLRKRWPARCAPARPRAQPRSSPASSRGGGSGRSTDGAGDRAISRATLNASLCTRPGPSSQWPASSAARRSIGEPRSRSPAEAPPVALHARAAIEVQQDDRLLGQHQHLDATPQAAQAQRDDGSAQIGMRADVAAPFVERHGDGELVSHGRARSSSRAGVRRLNQHVPEQVAAERREIAAAMRKFILPSYASTAAGAFICRRASSTTSSLRCEAGKIPCP